MNVFNVLSLFGGLAMFLYGMRLMGDSLKENSLGDHAVNIAAYAESMNENETKFSEAAVLELAALESALRSILAETEQTFTQMDVDADVKIEALTQVSGDLITVLRRNHLKRMGTATVVRARPELADHEHLYFDRLHAGGDDAFNAVYDREHQQYFAMLNGAETAAAGQLETN